MSLIEFYLKSIILIFEERHHFNVYRISLLYFLILSFNSFETFEAYISYYLHYLNDNLIYLN